jgi:hypothetical protein
LLGTYESTGSVTAVAAEGNYAFLADDVDDVVIVNVTNPASPTLASSYALSGQVSDIAYASNFLHVAHQAGGYTVLNVINRTTPTRSASYDSPGLAVGVFVYNEITYLADYYSLILLFFQDFSPGDANGDGQVNGVDVVYMVNYFKGFGPPPDPILRGDCNGDCNFNGVDVVYLVNYFKGYGPPPIRGNC